MSKFNGDGFSLFDSCTDDRGLTNSEVNSLLNGIVNGLWNSQVYGVLICNMKGEVVKVNQRVLTLFETDASELIGQEMNQICPQVEWTKHFKNYNHEFGKLISSSVFREKIKCNGSAEKTFVLELFSCSVIDDQKCYCCLIHELDDSRNIWIDPLLSSKSETKQDSPDELIKLRRQNEMKDRLFSIISHDLKNPINLLIGFTELLGKGLGVDAVEKSRKYQELIAESAFSISQLLENLLHWSRIQKHKTGVDRVRFNLDAVIRETIQLHKIAALSKEIELTSDCPSDLYVFADRNMTSTVLRNLVSNAIKFTKVRGKVAVSAQMKDSYSIVIVTDTGVGIQSDAIQELFNPDKLFTTYGTAGEKGTGLGLSICKEFIMKNNGDIWAESEPGKGTSFYFTLPTTEE